MLTVSTFALILIVLQMVDYQGSLKFAVDLSSVAVALYFVVMFVRSKLSASARAKYLAAKAADKREARDVRRAELVKAVHAALPSPDTQTRILSCSVTQLIDAYKASELSPVDVVATYCHRAHEAGVALSCTAEELFDEALEAAELAAKRYADGTARPMEGVPVSIKDCIAQKGYDATCGLATKCFQPFAEDAVVVDLLRSVGAIPFVRSNVPQGLLLPESDNAVWGASANPYDVTRTPGGSSGGEAALIAAGASPIGIGSDIGGSIRIPAHFTGVVGFKPTPQRITMKGSVPPRVWKTTGQGTIRPTVGPLGRTVDDVELVMKTWCGDAMFSADPTVPHMPWRDEMADGSTTTVAPTGKPLRVGYYTTDGYFDAAPACARAVTEAVAALEKAGVECVKFDPFDVPASVNLMYAILSADGCFEGILNGLDGEELHPTYKKLYFLAQLPRSARPLLAGFLSLIGQKRAADITRVAYGKTTSEMWGFVRRLDQYKASFFAGVKAAGIDAILCPGLALPAWKHGGARELTPACSYTFLFNVLHMPAGNVPMSFVRPDEAQYNPPPHQNDILAAEAKKHSVGSEGLPVTVQVAGLPFHDETVMKVMKLVEANHDMPAAFHTRYTSMTWKK